MQVSSSKQDGDLSSRGNRSSADSVGMSELAVVGRQPILDEQFDLFAYELLFRGPAKQMSLEPTTGETATASVLKTALVDIGLERIAGHRKVFVNLTRDMLVHSDLTCLASDRFVLEVLEDVPPDEEVLRSVARLSAAGFTIALDDYVYRPELDPLVEAVDIVKIDLPLISPDDLSAVVQRLQDLGKIVLAEKVETFDDFERCRVAGCSLFQGYFFCRPQLIREKTPAIASPGMLQLVAALNSPQTTVAEIEQLLESQPRLCFQILRFVNSASVTTRHDISSIRHAVTVLGTARIRSLASLMLMSDVIENRPSESICVAMIRAKACELLARHTGDCDPDEAFTVGMFSVFDALLDLPIEEVVAMMPFHDEINAALIQHSGKLGGILSLVLNAESGGQDTNEFQSAVWDAIAAATMWTTEHVIDV